MVIKSNLHSTWLEGDEGVLFESIPDVLASTIHGGSTNYDTNQRLCVNGDCHYDEKRVEDGETVYQYSGPKSPFDRLFDIGIDISY
ncbi:MAG: hypothetical protein AAF268_12820 [Cyanobacteria bacterium P01_A01_bin.3]